MRVRASKSQMMDYLHNFGPMLAGFGEVEVEAWKVRRNRRHFSQVRITMPDESFAPLPEGEPLSIHDDACPVRYRWDVALIAGTAGLFLGLAIGLAVRL